MSDLHDNQRAAFDDDRLLDYALGIEDDPELTAALAHSTGLRERLADLKSDLSAIEDELRRTIPPVDDAYLEPSPDHWPRLARFMVHDDVRRRPRRGRRLTAGFAAAALVLAVIVGLVSILPRNVSSPNSGLAAKGGEGLSAAGAPAANGQTPATAPAAPVVAAYADGFRTVAVVRAGRVTNGRQSFTLVRALKGAIAARFTLSVSPATKPASAGSLQIAYLDPLTTSAGRTITGQVYGAGTPTGAASPASGAVAGAGGGGSSPPSGSRSTVVSLYRFHGAHGTLAATTPLPPGVDAASVRLP